MDERRARASTQLEEAQRLCHVGSFEWDVKSGVVICSDEMYRILGLSRGELEPTREALLALLHPDDRERAKNNAAELLRSGRTFVGEQRIVRPDGTVREIETRGEVARDARGEATAVIGSAMDVTDLHESQRHLEHKRSLLNAALEATADGLLVVDRTGRVVTSNERFRSLWRLPDALARTLDDAQLIASVLEQVVEPEAFVRGVKAIYAEPERESFDVIRFKDGRIYERYSRPQRISGSVTGRVWSFRDVTERERALRAREELLAVVAHEIRSPIMSMNLAVQTLRHAAATADARRRALDIVEREGHRLTRFVDELIDAGRIQSGRLEFRLEDVDLAELARSVAEQLAPELAHARSTLSLQLDTTVHGHWDRFRLEEVLVNLLSNAMKYGAGKPIELEVHQFDGHVLLRVTDHGVGIPPEMKDKIFLPYERAARQFGGVGLGLYIVKTIVQGLGGSIRVDSRQGDVTTFTVDLPLDGSPPMRRASRNIHREGRNLRGSRK
jgi:PAS domain S-box-containing protein